jgi:hypothetical protein
LGSEPSQHHDEDAAIGPSSTVYLDTDVFGCALCMTQPRVFLILPVESKVWPSRSRSNAMTAIGRNLPFAALERARAP